MRRLGLLLAAVVLAVAVLASRVAAPAPPEQNFRGSVRALLPLPTEVIPWKVEFVPVAETQEMRRAVEELLNFDEAFHMVCTNSSARIAIYVAYWSPGKMSPRLIAGHTPDVCWVGSGWRGISADQMAIGLSSSTAVDPSPVLRPAETLGTGSDGTLVLERREFVRDGISEHVIFAHLVGGKNGFRLENASLAQGGLLPRWWRHAAQQREEQFFIRISSDRPLARQLQEPPVRIFLARLIAGLWPERQRLELGR